MAANTERQNSLSSEIEKLQDTITGMNASSNQQNSMHQAMVEGLESQCERLSEENAEIYDELNENVDYIDRLEATLRDVQGSCNMLKQKKINSEMLSNQIISGVKKLTGIATAHAAELEGFSSKLLSQSPWTEHLEFLSQWIDHANEELKRLQTSLCQVSAEAATPKTKGNNGAITATDLASQHLDILYELRNTKEAIGNILSSPKLTPIKSRSPNEYNVQKKEGFGEDFLYSDLLRAHEQLENLSKKIEVFQDTQKQWEEKEMSLQSRILTLEQEPQGLRETEQAKMKEASIVMMSNFQHRYHQRVTQHAFQTWSSQVRMSKNIAIAKEMAKEFAKTQEKVLLLKSHLE